MLQLAPQVFKFHHRSFQSAGPFARRRIILLNLTDETLQLAHPVHHARPVVIHDPYRLPRDLHQLRAVGGPLVALLQLSFHSRIDLRPFNFLHLVPQQFQFLLTGLLGIVQFLPSRLLRPPLRPALTVGLPQSAGPSIGIKHQQLSLDREKRLMIMGPVEIHQVLTDRLQHAQGGR